MKLRTKICLVCVAAMLVLSQSFSLFMLYISQKISWNGSANMSMPYLTTD